MYYIHRALIASCLIALVAAAWWSIRVARADAAFRQGTPEQVARAVELAPGNSDYLSTLALQAEYTGQDPTPLLEQLAAEHPRSSAPRIRLGLAAELRGDAPQAERWLQQAYSVDHQFETRWTLANFYFRQGRTDDFWKWIRSALEVSYGDRGAAFDLCWEMTGDPQAIVERAIPERREVAAAYLAYVLQHHRANAVAGAANLLARIRTADDLPLLNGATDALLDAGQGRAAEELWAVLGNSRPSGVTHPNFEAPESGHGFDWRLAEVTGVTHIHLSESLGHRIRFDGHQPESCELLRQILGGLRPGARYVLQWESRTQAIISPAGLEWRIGSNGAAITASEDWSTGTMTFIPDSEEAVLMLTYKRPEGQVRTEGQLDLRRIISSPE
jgi:tetratricopeptide (TPR) repeat protein